MSITRPLYFFHVLPTWTTLTRHQCITYIELDNILRNFLLHYHRKTSFLAMFQTAWISFNTLATFTTLLRHKNIHKIVMNYFLRIIYSANIIMNHISNWKWHNHNQQSIHARKHFVFVCFNCDVRNLVEDIRTMLGKQWSIFSCNIKISK